MDTYRKQALQVAKEIVVKFIEIGRISPTNFQEYFSEVYNEVLRTITAETPAVAAKPEPGADEE